MASGSSNLTPAQKGAIKAFGGIKRLKGAWDEFDRLLTKFSTDPARESKDKLDSFLQTFAAYLQRSIEEILPAEDHQELWRGFPPNPVLRFLILPSQFYSMIRAGSRELTLDGEMTSEVLFYAKEHVLAHKVVESALAQLKGIEVEVRVEEVQEALTPREAELLSAPGLLELRDFTRIDLAQTLDEAGKQDDRYRPETKGQWSDSGIKLLTARLTSDELGIAEVKGKGRGAKTNWTPVGARVIQHLSDDS